MGAVTQPWRAEVTFRGIDPDVFAGFAEPGYAKIVWTLEAAPLGPAASWTAKKSWPSITTPGRPKPSARLATSMPDWWKLFEVDSA